MRDQVFISYSHCDEKWLEKLRTHLKPFERTHQIQVWDDTRIESGDRWREELGRALAAARVAVLLVSPDYLASDFVVNHELPPLLDAAEREGLRILWVAVSASAYLETPIKDYQAANDPARPLDSLKTAKLNEELVKVCEAVRSAAAVEPEPAATARQPRRRVSKSEPDTAPPPLQDSGSRPISRNTLERVIAEQLAGSARGANRRRHFSPTRWRVLALLLLMLGVAAVAISYYRLRPTKQPPIIVPIVVDEEFINLEKWTVPPTGWRLDMSHGGGSLEVTNQPQVGYLSAAAYADFEAAFALNLLSNRGAAWALRVNGEGDYYLFYLSGPGGLYPRRFLSYVVRDGKPDPRSERSTNVIAELKEGESYQVEIKAEGSKFTHLLTNNVTGEEIRLGDFVDPHNTYPQGSIGFRTMNGEKFSVDDLFIYPPGTKKP